MNIKMIVTDLDRTLLRSDKTVSEYTSSVFRRCHEAGIKIVFATARPIRTVKNLLCTDIENDACIYHNGAVTEIGGKRYKDAGIGYGRAGKLLEALNQVNGLKISVEINDTMYTNFDDPAILQGYEFTLIDFKNLPKLPVDKILFGVTKDFEIKNLEPLLGEDLYWEVSENEIVMIMNKNARKLNAVKDAAKYYGFSLADIIAFGDDYNDVEMLRECGVGVAVANAIPEAKAAADFICGGCDEDGVARWLEENILNRS